MFRDILTNKWFIGGFSFLIVFGIGCYFSYQHDTIPHRKAAAEVEKLLRQSEKLKKVAKTDSKVEQTTDGEVGNDIEGGDTTAAQTPAANAEAEVRVSPFGFGPYPELPPDFPWQDLFDPPYYAEDPNHPYKDEPNYELMDRLWVELWKRGEKVEGFGTMESTGLFYPTIRGTIYVRWAPRWKDLGHGIGKKIQYINGHPDDIKRLESAKTEGDIPSDLKVLDISEGIDPYTFLDLPKSK